MDYSASLLRLTFLALGAALVLLVVRSAFRLPHDIDDTATTSLFGDAAGCTRFSPWACSQRQRRTDATSKSKPSAPRPSHHESDVPRHPLDPLTVTEVNQARELLLAHPPFASSPSSLAVHELALDEPDKPVVRRWRKGAGGGLPPRRAVAVVRFRGESHVLAVDLAADRALRGAVLRPGVQRQHPAPRRPLGRRRVPAHLARVVRPGRGRRPPAHQEPVLLHRGHRQLLHAAHRGSHRAGRHGHQGGRPSLRPRRRHPHPGRQEHRLPPRRSRRRRRRQREHVRVPDGACAVDRAGAGGAGVRGGGRAHGAVGRVGVPPEGGRARRDGRLPRGGAGPVDGRVQGGDVQGHGVGAVRAVHGPDGGVVLQDVHGRRGVRVRAAGHAAGAAQRLPAPRAVHGRRVRRRRRAALRAGEHDLRLRAVRRRHRVATLREPHHRHGHKGVPAEGDAGGADGGVGGQLRLHRGLGVPDGRPHTHQGWAQRDPDGEGHVLLPHEPGPAERGDVRHPPLRERHRRHPRPLRHLSPRHGCRRHRQLLRPGRDGPPRDRAGPVPPEELPEGRPSRREHGEGCQDPDETLPARRVPRHQPDEEDTRREPGGLQGRRRRHRRQLARPRGPAAKAGCIHKQPDLGHALQQKRRMGRWAVRVPEQRGGHTGYLVGEGPSDREQGHRAVVHARVPPRPVPGGLPHHAHRVVQLRPQAGQLLREQPDPQAAAHPGERPPGLRRYSLRPLIHGDILVSSVRMYGSTFVLYCASYVHNVRCISTNTQ